MTLNNNRQYTPFGMWHPPRDHWWYASCSAPSSALHDQSSVRPQTLAPANYLHSHPLSPVCVFTYVFMGCVQHSPWIVDTWLNPSPHNFTRTHTSARACRVSNQDTATCKSTKLRFKVQTLGSVLVIDQMGVIGCKNVVLVGHKNQNGTHTHICAHMHTHTHIPICLP